MIKLSESLSRNMYGVYYEKDFRNILEDHISFLQIRDTNTEVNVEPHIAYKYDKNFYGLLEELKYPSHLHWVFLRANGLTNPREYNHNNVVIIAPDISFIEQLMKTHTAMESYI